MGSSSTYRIENIEGKFLVIWYRNYFRKETDIHFEFVSLLHTVFLHLNSNTGTEVQCAEIQKG
jgi:hypothetical protein